MSIRFNHRTGLIETTGASGLVVYDSGGTDSATFSHDGTDFNSAFVTTTDWNVTGLTANVRLEGAGLSVIGDGKIVGAANTAITASINMFNDGTDGNIKTFGTAADVRIGNYGTATGYVSIEDGYSFRVFDSTTTDYVDFSHDGTDFNIAGTTTTDINITGITAIAAGTVDADFDAITATSYGGITEANLVDKTANETITGTWTIDKIITGSNSVATETDILLTDNGNIGATQSMNFITDTDNTQTGTAFKWLTNAPGETSATTVMTLNENGNLVGVGTLTGFTSISAATIGGITEANLLDKTATETISGNYTFSASPYVTSVAPQYFLQETGVTADNTIWSITADGEVFSLRAWNDAVSVQSPFMQVNRTGTTIDAIDFTATNIDANGNMNVTNGLDVTGTITGSTLTNNDVLIAGSGGAIEDSGGKVTYDGSSFAAYGDGTATDLHYLGIDTNDRFRFECGTNYGMILYEDNNVSTENSFFYIGNDTVSTGRQSIYFRKGGSDWFQADNFGSSSRFEFTGPLEIAGTTDHVGDTGLGTDVSSDRIQIWAKSRSLDHEPMITTGDQDLDYTFTNVNVMSYHHDQTTASADPGAGNIRWNSLTPASVTNLYIDDLESTGRDASFMLSNLADGDILTIRATWDAADYLVCSVNGTPTDNTGWWTVPVTIIHSGAGAPTTGDPIHIGVEWAGSQGGGSGTVTSVAAGNGMDFTTITTTGSVTMGTPGSLSSSSTNAVTATSHTHEITSIDAVDIAAGNLASGVNIYQTANPANSAYKVLFSGATTGVTTSGNYTVNFDNGSGEFIYNPNTNTLTVGTVAAALSGNATTATTATNVTVADESADTTCFPLFVTAATGNLAPKTGSNLTFNSSTGHFTATSKSFLIDHPTKAGKKLQYGSLEGPENGVYVRGRLTGSDTIELPDYWTALIDPNSITVNLTPIGSHQELYVADIADNKVVVGGSADNMDFFYTVYAERVDVDKLEIEFDSEDV